MSSDEHLTQYKLVISYLFFSFFCAWAQFERNSFRVVTNAIYPPIRTIMPIVVRIAFLYTYMQFRLYQQLWNVQYPTWFRVWTLIHPYTSIILANGQMWQQIIEYVPTDKNISNFAYIIYWKNLNILPGFVLGHWSTLTQAPLCQIGSSFGHSHRRTHCFVHVNVAWFSHVAVHALPHVRKTWFEGQTVEKQYRVII